jgi:hypothetical protein
MRRRDARRRGERGAVIVEAAICAPVLLFVLFGIMEVSHLFRTYSNMANLASQASRAAGVFGKQPKADFELLRTIEREMVTLSPSDLEVLIVWRLTEPDGQPPAACFTTSVPNVCNRYTAGDFTRDEADFGCDPSLPSPDVHWCPTSRKSALTGPNGPPDYIGVHLQTTHRPLLNMGPERTVQASSITRIEPDRRQ